MTIIAGGRRYAVIAKHIPLLTILLSSITLASAATPGKLVFQLKMDDPQMGRMLRNWAQVVPDGAGQAIQADARKDEVPWHVFFSVPAGVLKGGQDYVATLDYEVIDLPDPQACFFMVAGNDLLGAGPNQMLKWTGQAGDKGHAMLNLSLPRADGGHLLVGINRHGALKVTGLEVREGSTWLTIPAQTGGELPPPGKPREPAMVPTGAEEFKVEPPTPKTDKVVSVADFGAVPDGPDGPAAGAAGNRQAFMRAIAACKGGRAARLVIPPGVYRFTVKEPVLFEDLEDVVVDGQGAELIFSKLALPAWPAAVEVNRCRRCVIRNLKIDWDWETAPLAYVGRILARADDGTFDMEFPDVKEIPEQIAWRSFWPLEPQTRGFTRDGEWHFTPRNVQKIQPNVLRGTPPWPIPVKVGDLFLIRQFEYERHAFHMMDDSDLSLQGIEVYSMPGMGWVTRRNMHHWEMVDCKITPRPGSHRPITCTADGLNTEDSLGYFRMLHCDFSGQGDDAVNIKDLTNLGITVLDHNSLMVDNVNFDRHPYAVGDVVELRRADHSPLGFASKLTAVNLDKPKKQATLTFADALPDPLRPDTILVNRRYDTANILIRDCLFHDNRNRGILLNARQGTIENCRFDRVQGEPILIESSATPRWSEGTGMTNLVIRGNTFVRCNPKGTFEGATICVGTDLPVGDSTHPCTRDVLVEDNQFVDCPGLALRLVSCRNVIVRRNTFANPTALPEPLECRGVIRAWQASQLQILDNTWKPSPFVRLPAVQVDPLTASNVTVLHNRS